MIIMLPQVEITSNLNPITGKQMVEHIEKIARTCYKSDHLIKEGSAEGFVQRLIKSGHTAMIEHASVSVKFICSRAASHQIVRHRMASYAQESQRYCNYTKDKFDNSITFIIPPSFTIVDRRDRFSHSWLAALRETEKDYFELIEAGAKPQEARMVLPNSTKTELNMTANLREWRAFFDLRTELHADDEIRCLAKMLLEQFYFNIPGVFDDIYFNRLGPGAPADPVYDSYKESMDNANKEEE